MTDRQTDRQTDARGKTICLPTLKGGDIISPDVTSHLGLFCLPMSHKKDAMLMRVNILCFLVIFILYLNIFLAFACALC